MKIKFKKDFWWGTSISGPQSEGAFEKPNLSVMDYWYSQTPTDFHNYVGPRTTSDMYHKYREDVKMMKDLKLNCYRTSIQWTRLIKDFKNTEVDPKAVKFYKDYFKRIKKAKIKLIVNLFHFDMPIELQNIGGFENKEVVNMFVKYAKKCFELFGHLVDDWATFNEPIVPLEGGYLYQWYYPKIVDFKRAVQAGYGTILAHAKVVNAFKEVYGKNKKKRITTILNLTPTYPKDNQPKNMEAALIRDTLFNRSFLDPVLKGEFPDLLIKLLKEEKLMPSFTKEELSEIKKAKSKIDYLSINYYQPARVQARTKKYTGKIMPEKWFENYEWKERRINPYRGWEIHPQTLYNIAIDIKENYNNIDWLVSENGMGVENEERFRNKKGFIEDDYRIDFVKEHLYWLNKAIEKGSNCFGYQMWTFIDCWSWGNSYKNRYGLVELDLNTQKRIIKKSGYWFKSIIENNNEITIEPELVKSFR